MTGKHGLSPPPDYGPPSKRKRVEDEDVEMAVDEPETGHFTMTLVDELVLHIFSYLDFADLCVSNLVCQNWRRLSLENLLWRDLYLGAFTRPRLRGLRGHFRRADGRATRPLPGRVHAEDVQDWKWMYRVSYNWKRGRCKLDEIPHESPAGEHDSNHILMAGPLLISASSSTLAEPVLRIRAGSTHYSIPCPSTLHTPCYITALVQDQSPPEQDELCFVAFLSTGEYVEHVLHANDPTTVRRRLVYVPRSLSDRTAPIIQAAYHHPLLVTLSESFHLSIYHLSPDSVEHTQTLTSFTSYPPSSLVLSVPSPGQYKLVMAYAIPVYPEHYSVGCTELIISAASVTSTRSARAFDVPQGWVDQAKYQAMREQWDRKVSGVAGCQTDGRWVVLAARDGKVPSGDERAWASCSVLQLYRLSLSSGKPKLTFYRTLHGPTEPVTAMTVADGRCVTLGVRGSIWVWDLETGDGAQVADVVRQGSVSQYGAIAFDERRIVSIHGTAMSVRRFDV